MKICQSHGDVERGVEIMLTGDEVALAIDAYLVAHNVIVYGPRTIRVNNHLCAAGSVFLPNRCGNLLEQNKDA